MDCLGWDGELAGAEEEIRVSRRSPKNVSCVEAYKCRGKGDPYPKGSPTTRKATSCLAASARISSLEDSTISRSASMRGRP